jgi:hypothetical protein
MDESKLGTRTCRVVSASVVSDWAAAWPSTLLATSACPQYAAHASTSLRRWRRPPPLVPAGSHGSAILRTSRSNTGSTTSTGIWARSSPMTLVGQPRLCAATPGNPSERAWPRTRLLGNRCPWTGSPQWQIEGLRRLEIPEEMQKNTGSNRWERNRTGENRDLQRQPCPALRYRSKKGRAAAKK